MGEILAKLICFKVDKKCSKMLTQKFRSIFGLNISTTIGPINVVPRSLSISFKSSFHELQFCFLNASKCFLELFPFSGILVSVSEAAILAYKQKIFKMLPTQFLIYKVKSSFVPNSKHLPRLAQFLDVSVVPEVNDQILPLLFQVEGKHNIWHKLRCI